VLKLNLEVAMTISRGGSGPPLKL